MNSVCLLPYCPLPVDSGARSIFHKHLSFLHGLGKCSILSAERRPVGFGWSSARKNELLLQGYQLDFFRPSFFSRIVQLYGMGYALFFKALRQEKAFGHSNPYHRYAFSSDWLYQHTKNTNLCEIHYSFWARLETACPKVVIVHDLWSDIMWEGKVTETAELKGADLLITVSYDDKVKLIRSGIENVHWSPPCIEQNGFDDSTEVAIIGSGNRHNLEGLNWLKNGLKMKDQAKIHCYGAIGKNVEGDTRFLSHGQYQKASAPYQHCGIVLMLTTEGTGIQIKGVEALAAGRAVIARKGAMRGLPRDIEGWIEVETVEEMYSVLKELRSDAAIRKSAMNKAREYYQEYLEKNKIFEELRCKYTEL